MSRLFEPLVSHRSHLCAPGAIDVGGRDEARDAGASAEHDAAIGGRHDARAQRDATHELRALQEER